MNVLVACAEDKTYDFRMAVHDIGYEEEKTNFFMPRPIGDDWLQRINHKPIPPPEMVNIQDKVFFVLFQNRECAEAFSAWLVDAEAEAQHGYRTMRG